MRRILCSLALVVAAVIITFSATMASENRRYAGAKAGLVMRELPDVSGKKIVLVPFDDEVILHAAINVT